VTLDRAEFQHLIQTYYRLMGWDDLGLPTRESLIASDLADALALAGG
jgi:aldehyde:ferredoxin oxidoreductase